MKTLPEKETDASRENSLVPVGPKVCPLGNVVQHVAAPSHSAVVLLDQGVLSLLHTIKQVVGCEGKYSEQRQQSGTLGRGSRRQTPWVKVAIPYRLEKRRAVSVLPAGSSFFSVDGECLGVENDLLRILQ